MGTQHSRERAQNWMHIKFREALRTGRNMINKEKFIAQFCLELFASERTAKELLKLYESTGLIRVHRDDIEVILR